ncbi:hypothetical protein [Bradyrhizobium australafricanum]|uniref:hypothetical protein n=1 Tax=Bradyrhizobium australafricanum TaxID=2821406 RepID=UPI001CE24811|nr:hypothetical protein [Bradyrhizobium australafricanum]MCA6104585.1 hypothetical protein [Bradyrhizobium australafricanum]
MAELDAIKQVTVSGLVFRRDRAHRKSRTPPPWITERKDLRYLRSVVKDIVAAAGRHRSARQLRIYAKRTRKQLSRAMENCPLGAMRNCPLLGLAEERANEAGTNH